MGGYFEDGDCAAAIVVYAGAGGDRVGVPADVDYVVLVSGYGLCVDVVAKMDCEFINHSRREARSRGNSFSDVV